MSCYGEGFFLDVSFLFLFLFFTCYLLHYPTDPRHSNAKIMIFTAFLTPVFWLLFTVRTSGRQYVEKTRSDFNTLF